MCAYPGAAGSSEATAWCGSAPGLEGNVKASGFRFLHIERAGQRKDTHDDHGSGNGPDEEVVRAICCRTRR